MSFLFSLTLRERQGYFLSSSSSSSSPRSVSNLLDMVEARDTSMREPLGVTEGVDWAGGGGAVGTRGGRGALASSSA